MIKFNFLSITIIFLTFVLTIGNYFVFSEKSVNVGAINKPNSSLNNSISSPSSVSSSISRSSIPKSSTSISSSKNQTSVSSIKTSSLISSTNQISSPKTSSSMILNSSSSFSLVSSPVSKTSSSKLSSSTVSLSSKNSSSSSSSRVSVIPIVQNPNPPPIKITEVGFMRPEDYNNNLCLTSENNCGQFKWLEIFNPNESEVNLKDYRIVFGSFIDNSITDVDFLINPKSFALVKNYSVTQTTSIVDQFPNVAPTTFVKNIDNKIQNNLSVIIQNSAKVTLDSFVIENLSTVAAINSGKIKTSFFRCSDPTQNQNYTLTEKKPANQIPYNNSLGYEFYGTLGKDDDSCTTQSSSSTQPLLSVGGINVIKTPPVPVIETKVDTVKATIPAVDPVKITVVATDPVPQSVKNPQAEKLVETAKEIITSKIEVKIPEIIPTPSLVTTKILSYELPKNMNIQIAALETKKEPVATEQKTEIKEVVAEAKPAVNKLVEYYKQIAVFEKSQSLQMSNKVESIEYQNTILNETPKINVNKIQSKPFVPITKEVIKPITKKVALPVINQETKEIEILEIDYQPSHQQWKFLSIIAIAFVLSKIYREFRDKIGVEVLGIQRV